MAARFRIHPAIGIARLGNIPDKFYIAADQGGQLPIQCDDAGYPIIDKDGHEVRVTRFKDEAGRIMRQAARFRVFVYDDRSPDGREVSIGDEFDIVAPRTGQLLIVRIDDIKWTVYLANKKSSWYKFEETNGEHGYDSDHPDHPLRNAHVTNTEERQRLIIDPGPRSVRYKNEAAQRARFDGQGGVTSFPPELAPNSIHTLGELRCTQSANINRLLVLGGFGNSGSMLDGFGNPKIEAYANNDGWFDDTADNNPLSNTALAKFFRLTDTMLFMLRQWAAGLFIDEQAEGIDPGLLPPGCRPVAAMLWIASPSPPASAVHFVLAPRRRGLCAIRRFIPHRIGFATRERRRARSPAIRRQRRPVWRRDWSPATSRNTARCLSNRISTNAPTIDVTYRDWNSITPDSSGDPVRSSSHLTYWWPCTAR
jgi:L-Lysine epsilon oxidase N-terminal